ncbi:MAG TPA: hypothetical protein VNK04_24595 [Gemmataceae bacterium]|nr:hypothetical protein [Gemmataceae bacterium]
MSQQEDLTRRLGESLEEAIRSLGQVAERLSGVEPNDARLEEQLGSALDEFRNMRAERARSREQLARLQADLDEVRRQCEELAVLVAELRKEKTSLEWERDQYVRSLQALLPKPPPMTITEEELLELEGRGVTFDQILKDIEDLTKGA